MSALERSSGTQPIPSYTARERCRSAMAHMKRRSLFATAVVCLAAMWSNSFAGDAHYECTVNSAGRLTEQGILAPHWSTNSTVGSKFTVNRETGRVVGGPLDNSNLKIELIDRGGREMSFQAFSRSTQRTHTSLIEIQEFIPGADKPFVGTTTLYYPGVYSGICK